MQEIDHNSELTPENNKRRAINKKFVIFTITATFIAVSVFASGWLIGSGKIKLRANSFIPISEVLNTKKAPTDGVNNIYTLLKENFDGKLQDSKILDGIKAGLVKSAGDPYTVYLSKQETKEFKESLNGTFEGIGAELGKKGNFIIIVAPIKGTPAFKAGVQPQDIIVEIDGESSTDISITEAVKRIRGPKGETVILTIIRDGAKVKIPIVRDTINIPSVEWKQDGTLGIISISRFGDDTTALTRKAANDLKAKGITGVVLDLRGDPGGFLDAAVNVSSVWLPKGSTVLEEKRDGEVINTFRTKVAPIFDNIPTVILINKGSASASEIVSGALHDNKMATLMGVQSFGKGSVQRIIPLDNGGSLKVTIAHWFTPDGKSINKEGLKPDKEVKITKEDRIAKKDPQLEAAKLQLRQ